MQQPDPQTTREPRAARLNAFQAARTLEDMLGRLEEAVARDLDAKATRAHEDLDDAVGAHAAEQGLVGEPCEGRAAVAVEDVLATGDLGPVDPGRDCCYFVP